SAIIGGIEQNLGNAWKFFPNDISVFAAIGSQLVKVNLLIKIPIFFGTLIPLRIARVIEARSVCFPCNAAGGGGTICAGHAIAQLFSAVYFENTRRSNFRSILRKRDRDQISVDRRSEIVDAERSRAADAARIQDDFFASGVIGRAQADEDSALFGRLRLAGKDQSRLVLRVVVRARAAAHQFFYPSANGGP